VVACDGGGGQQDGDTWTTDTAGKDTQEPEDSGGEDTTEGQDTYTGEDTNQDRDTGVDGDGGNKCFKCVDDKYKVDKVVNCSEDADKKPARCDKKPENFSNWGPGSVITSFEMTSEDAQECCFNIDGSKDGSNDNGLATLLSFLPGADVDTQIKQALTNGTFVVLNEHQGLTSLNYFLGNFGSETASDYVKKKDNSCNFGGDSECELTTSSGETFLINPESFDRGVQPQAQLSPAKLNDSTIDAGPGIVVLNLNLPGLGTLALRINGATIEATVDKDKSDLEGDGVVVKKGKLGGYVLLKDVIGLINNLMSSCDCLDNPETAIAIPNTDPSDPDLKPKGCRDGSKPEEECELTCKKMVQMKADGDACNGTGGVCEQSGTICSSIGLMADTADLDVDGDGNKDALSIGALFEMVGAKIDGIADYVKAGDQTLSSNNKVTVSRVFANEKGWVVIHEKADGGGIGDPIGAAEVQAGNNADITVNLDKSLSSEQPLWAMVHKDDGSGSFEAGNDPAVKLYSNASSPVVTKFTVTPQ
ncbi:MAG: hypothetical protein ABEN55_16735, partial [Bradymonadaceae bacterium]